MIRIRVNFDKTEAMRFTGHLDLYRTWERTLRRANLPLAYSQGFKPHPRIQFAAALPLGFTSSNDLMDIWLEEEIPLEDLYSQLSLVLPPGLRINSLSPVPLSHPALQAILRASEYLITFMEAIPDLSHRIEEVIKKPSIVIERRNKRYDLRPLLLALELVAEGSQSDPCLHVLLKTNSTVHARPDDLIQVMELRPEKALFHRFKLYFDGEE